MKNTLVPYLASYALLSLSPSETQAQVSGNYSIGINAGAFIYNGDLSPWRTGSWKTPGFAWGFTGHRSITPTLAARLDVSFGKLRGDEAKYTKPEYRQQRAFAFNANVTEVVLSAEWTPVVIRKRWSPYAFAGVGYAGTKISRDYSRFNAEYFSAEPLLAEGLQKDIATTPPKGVAVFPVGFGLMYKLNDKFSLHGEAAQRFTRSDYVDGFSQAGNPKQKDSYTKYSVGVRMALGNKDPYACPKVLF